jgi:exopolysaccharide biosynthesis polyprenyl glycosylphosphotransferase
LAENLAAVRAVDRGKAGARPVPVIESKNHLKSLLVVGDSIALLFAWSIAVSGWNHAARTWWVSMLIVPAMTLIGLWVQHAHSLYLARVCNIRLVEMSKVMRSAALIAVCGLAASRIFKVTLPGPEAVVGALLTLLFLIITRSAYRAWLSAARRSGRFTRDVILVGTNTEAARLHSLLADHPDTGLRIVGVVGDRIAAVSNGVGGLWCGPEETAGEVMVGKGANGVIIAAGALATDELNEMIRDLQARQAHVHISSGVQGIDYRRLLPAPLAHEPLMYLEPTELSRWQLGVKRALDTAASGLLLVIASPVMILAALGVKLTDRGPVFFKQTRVGKDGRLFKVYKFRSMVVDAEARLKALEATNERSGPLFKMERDPRVTRLGHFLRSSSIDELPQLINVLRGEMSLVGPRPALPSEVARFDDALLNRSKVKPGITGLWQVEARDNPAFSAYRRLDLFYVENWSVTLDLIILLATAEQVVARLVRILRRNKGTETDTTTEAATAAA